MTKRKEILFYWPAIILAAVSLGVLFIEQAIKDHSYDTPWSEWTKVGQGFMWTFCISGGYIFTMYFGAMIWQMLTKFFNWIRGK